ncbi:MAG: hypothetical protein K6T83_13285 [Alicyclobacillus sp.]|nr:hypothetical protein [Alicyclobacillus sp.]
MEAWMPPYRDNYTDKSVNKTVTLPRWLEETASEKRVNFSRVLQDALMSHLGIQVPRSYTSAVETTDDDVPIADSRDLQDSRAKIADTIRELESIGFIVAKRLGRSAQRVGAVRVIQGKSAKRARIKRDFINQ